MRAAWNIVASAYSSKPSVTASAGPCTSPGTGTAAVSRICSNASERDFLPLTDATVEPLGGGEGPQAHGFLAVQRSHVVFVVPLDPEAVERAT